MVHPRRGRDRRGGLHHPGQWQLASTIRAHNQAVWNANLSAREVLAAGYGTLKFSMADTASPVANGRSAMLAKFWSGNGEDRSASPSLAGWA